MKTHDKLNREEELAREWEMTEEQLQNDNIDVLSEEDWRNAERDSEDGWYYDDAPNERDGFAYDDEFSDEEDD